MNRTRMPFDKRVRNAVLMFSDPNLDYKYREAVRYIYHLYMAERAHDKIQAARKSYRKHTDAVIEDMNVFQMRKRMKDL